jgi:hypothetical protein
MALLFTPAFDYARASELGGRWLVEGASVGEVNARALHIAREIESDVPGLWRLKLRNGLTSSGFVWCSFLGRDRGPVFQNRSIPEQQRHRIGYYRWLTWTKQDTYRGDAESYVRGFRTPLFNSAKTQRALWKMIEPYLANCPYRLRDPLALGRLFPDVFAALGVVGMAVCFQRCWTLGAAITLPFFMNFAILTVLNLGSARYSYCMLPIAIFAASTGFVFLARARGQAASPAGVFEK